MNASFSASAMLVELVVDPATAKPLICLYHDCTKMAAPQPSPNANCRSISRCCLGLLVGQNVRITSVEDRHGRTAGLLDGVELEGVAGDVPSEQTTTCRP